MTGFTERALAERNRRFRQYVEQGLSWAEIQEKLGYKNRHSVYRIARELGYMEPSKRVSRAELEARWARIAELAAQGNSSLQISRALGMNREWIKEAARNRGIKFRGDELLAKRKDLDSNRIVEQTVVALQGAAAGLDLIDYSALDRSLLHPWADAIGPALSTLNSFHRKIKEAANDHD